VADAKAQWRTNKKRLRNYICGMTVVGSTDTINANSNDAKTPITAIAQTTPNSDQNVITPRKSWEWAAGD
jgi:hypothetical protein